jgi:hypothetical protein
VNLALGQIPSNFKDICYDNENKCSTWVIPYNNWKHIMNNSWIFIFKWDLKSKNIYGWKHTKGESLSFLKKWFITNIMVDSKLKHPLTILNIKKKKIISQQFEIESSLWIEINFDPMVRWKN